MPRMGLAADRMSTEQLWNSAIGGIMSLRLSMLNRDPLPLRLRRADEIERMLRELRHRGEQLPLVPQHQGRLGS